MLIALSALKSSIHPALFVLIISTFLQIQPRCAHRLVETDFSPWLLQIDALNAIRTALFALDRLNRSAQDVSVHTSINQTPLYVE
jgi:hypothetical protein